MRDQIDRHLKELIHDHVTFVSLPVESVGSGIYGGHPNLTLNINPIKYREVLKSGSCFFS